MEKHLLREGGWKCIYVGVEAWKAVAPGIGPVLTASFIHSVPVLLQEFQLACSEANSYFGVLATGLSQFLSN